MAITKSGAGERTSKRHEFKAPKPKKCDGNTIYGFTTCGNAELVISFGKEGDLWGVKKCTNCGGTISWGD